MRKLLLLLLLAGSAAPAFATTYYVNKAGNNGNSCGTATSATDASAKLTVAAGITCLSSGDTLLIGDGVYVERIVNSVPSGSVGAPTIVKSENRNGAILRPSGSFYVVQITNPASYITFDGLDADGVNSLQAIYYLSADSGTVSNIRIINGKARNSKQDAGYGGIGIQCGAHGNPSGHHHIEVSGMDISGMENDSGDGSGGYGIYITCHDSLFENNNIHDNDGYAVHQYVSGGSGLDNNIVRNNTMDGAGIETGQSTSAVGSILISSGSGNHYYNNAIYGTPGHGIFLYAATDTTGIYYNTVYGNTGTCILIQSGNSGTINRNNICYGNGSNTISNSGSGTTSDHNLLGTNPLFLNAAIGDFHLTDSSPAIGAGVAISGITTDITGATRADPPSAGAYEAPSGSNPLDPLAETFDSYTTGASVNGLCTGAGWTGCWAQDGAATIETASGGMSGKELRLTSTSDVRAYRTFTAHSGDFTIQFKISSSITSPNSFGYGVNLYNTLGEYQTSSYFNSAGNIITDTQTLVSGFAINTAYTIEVHFDTAGHPNQSQQRVNGGSYSAWENCPTTCTSIAAFEVNSYSTNAHTFRVDAISDTVGGGSGTITVGAPATGAKCVSGSTCLISWSSNGITGNVNLYYLVGGNQYLIASPAFDATPYSWTVNAPAGTSSQVRATQGSVTDDGDLFTIYGTKAIFR